MHIVHAMSLAIGFGESAHAPTKCRIPQQRLSTNEYDNTSYQLTIHGHENAPT